MSSLASADSANEKVFIWTDTSVSNECASISVVAIRGEETIAEVAEVVEKIKRGNTVYAEFIAIVRGVELAVSQDWSVVTVYNDHPYAVRLACQEVWKGMPCLTATHAQMRTTCNARGIIVQHVERKKNRAHKLANRTLKQAITLRNEDKETE